MKGLLKGLSIIICLLFFFSNVCNCVNLNQQDKYIQIDSMLSVKFEGEPVKTFCQSALGDVTSFKYYSSNNSEADKYIYEVSVYKNIKSDTLKENGGDFLKYIITTEEMSILELNGKVLEKKELNFLGYPGHLFKIYFAELKNETNKGWINKNLYFKYHNCVVKLAVYVPERDDDHVVEGFFNSVKIGK